jgi:enoyl-CoA hydratase/carnithine racemase
MSDRVTVSVDVGVADVRLNRPEKRNALDGAMFLALAEAGERMKTEPGLRCVVLSGEGASFCAGLDFGSFQQMSDGDRPEGDRAEGERPAGNPGRWPTGASPTSASRWRGCGRRSRSRSSPRCTAALGGGIQIALGADIRIVHSGRPAVGPGGPLGRWCRT